MSKKILAFILTVAMVCSLCVAPALAADEQSVTFADAKGNWAESSINRWAAAGIITGDHNGNVTPDQFLTRAELATILVRLLGLTEKASANTFTDVAEGDWFADAILKCAAAGIMQGYAGKADPNDPITREQAITMVGRALGVKAQAGQSLAKFDDAAQVSAYATEYMAPLTAMGILSGVGDGSKVAPKSSIDRASAFALLDKAIAAYVTTPDTVTVDDANKFVIVNASAGDVTVTGATAGVLVTSGNKADVKLNKVEAATVKVDSPVTVDVTGSTLGSVDVNADATVSVDRTSKVGAVDTADAAGATINNNASTDSSRPTTSSGGTTPTATGAYTISVDTVVNGTVTVSPKKADAGKTITVTVSAKAGYELDTLSVTGVETLTKTSDTKYTFVMPAQNVTVSATFKALPVEPTYTITVDADIVGGTVTADKTSAKAGETVTLTVTPATGYELETLTVGGQAVAVTGTTYAFTMPAEDVTVTATFKATAVVEPDPVDPTNPVTYTFSVEANVTDAVVTEGLYGTPRTFFALGGTVDKKSDTQIELAKNKTGWIEFTVTGTDASITMSVSSTGSDSTSVGIYNGDTALTAATGTPATLTGLDPVTVTYTNVSKGTYRLVCDGSDRGARVYSISVTETGGEEPCAHTAATKAADVAATCTAAGKTGDTTCPTCNKTVRKGVPIAMLGHDFVNGTCTRCSVAAPAVETVIDLAKNQVNAAEDSDYITVMSGWNSGYVKFDSKGALTFLAPGAGTVTFGFTNDTNSAGKKLSINGEEKTVDATSYTVTMECTANQKFELVKSGSDQPRLNKITWTPAATTPVEPETVTVTVQVAGDAAAAVESAAVQGNATVEKGTQVTVVVKFAEDKNAAEYTVECDTVTFAPANAEANTVTGTHTANATVTLTITVKKAEAVLPSNPEETTR